MGIKNKKIKQPKRQPIIEGIANCIMLPYCNLTNAERKELGLPLNKGKDINGDYVEQEMQTKFIGTHPNYIEEDGELERDAEDNVIQYDNDYETLVFELYFKIDPRSITDNISKKDAKALKDKIFTIRLTLDDNKPESSKGKYKWIDANNNIQWKKTKEELENGRFGFDVSTARKALSNGKTDAKQFNFGQKLNEMDISEEHLNRMISVMLNLQSVSRDDCDDFVVTEEDLENFRNGHFDIFESEDIKEILKDKQYRGFPVLFYHKQNEKTGRMLQGLYLLHLTDNKMHNLDAVSIHNKVIAEASRSKYPVNIKGTYNDRIKNIKVASPEVMTPKENQVEAETTSEVAYTDDTDDIDDAEHEPDDIPF